MDETNHGRLVRFGRLVADALTLRTARARENIHDMLAEARARARGTIARGHLHCVPKGT